MLIQYIMTILNYFLFIHEIKYPYIHQVLNNIILSSKVIIFINENFATDIKATQRNATQHDLMVVSFLIYHFLIREIKYKQISPSPGHYSSYHNDDTP